jgi:xanthine/CO dehydrogenase XdhC/CoxF family maturation factor
MIGIRVKRDQTYKSLEKQAGTGAAGRPSCPHRLAIARKTPAEIAVRIMAEIIQIKKVYNINELQI